MANTMRKQVMIALVAVKDMASGAPEDTEHDT
jgi:hypothetical protein